MTRAEKTRTLRAKIQTLHDSGATVPDMMQALNLSKDVIYYHRQKMGLAQKRQKVELTGEQRQQVKALVKQNWSYKNVAAEFGISANMVKTIVHDSDAMDNRSISDVLADPVNSLLARMWA